MKLESLVILNQNVRVNTFPGVVHTARHAMGVCNARSRWPNLLEGAVEGRTSDWGQVVTRYPYENVGMDHLLSKETRPTIGRPKIITNSTKKSYIAFRDLGF